MKAVLTKRFWRGVTKTFYAALEGPPPNAEVKPQQSKAPEAKPSPDVPASSPDVGARPKAP